MPSIRSEQVVTIRPAEVLGDLNEVETKHAPDQLYCVGDLDLLRSGRRVSVVGSRAVSPEGRTRAATLTLALVERNVTIVSGLAKGVDAVAHHSAIKAGGRTVAVLGNPVTTYYPAENRALQTQIASRHLLVSQFPEGYPSFSKNWPQRNRTMALLSDATIIVEAAEKSGTIHQGWEALRLGRPLFLLQSLLENIALTWPAELQKYGAQVLTRHNMSELLDNIPERVSALDLAF